MEGLVVGIVRHDDGFEVQIVTVVEDSKEYALGERVQIEHQSLFDEYKPDGR